LLEPVLHRARERMEKCYLETETVKDVVFYQKLGSR
jgi:hypothetical protein